MKFRYYNDQFSSDEIDVFTGALHFAATSLSKFRVNQKNMSVSCEVM